MPENSNFVFKTQTLFIFVMQSVQWGRSRCTGLLVKSFKGGFSYYDTGTPFYFMTYSEKLKDPRWQQKRLRIMERDNWTCQCCKTKESTLHVHHLFYLKGREPWDYNDAILKTLCHECHKNEESNKEDFMQFIECLLVQGNNYTMILEMILSGIVYQKKLFDESASEQKGEFHG